jgi:hypothetical protein
MKKHLSYIIAAGVFLSAVVASCEKEKDEDPGIMQMTTSAFGKVSIILLGSGSAAIDWGDGSTKVTKTLPFDSYIDFSHNYSNTKTRIIKIYGNNITELNCSYNQLTDLDVSRNTALIGLYCFENQLMSLDVSKNSMLSFLSCGFNKLLTNELNTLFGMLPNNTDLEMTKIIWIHRNPGKDDCNPSIATERGWVVIK